MQVTSPFGFPLAAAPFAAGSAAATGFAELLGMTGVPQGLGQPAGAPAIVDKASLLAGTAAPSPGDAKPATAGPPASLDQLLGTASVTPPAPAARALTADAAVPAELPLDTGASASPAPVAAKGEALPEPEPSAAPEDPRPVAKPGKPQRVQPATQPGAAVAPGPVEDQQAAIVPPAVDSKPDTPARREARPIRARVEKESPVPAPQATAPDPTAPPAQVETTVAIALAPAVAPRAAAPAPTEREAPGLKTASAAKLSDKPAELLTPQSRNAPAIAVGAAPGRGDRGESRGQDEGAAQPQFAAALRHDAAPADAAAPGFTRAAPVEHAAAPAPAAPEPTLQARAGHLGQSLGVEIARKVDAGEESLRVRLNPAEFGRVEVTLAFDDGGTLQATIRAESAHALDLLRQDAPDLARTLDQAGIRADAQSFRFEARSDGNPGGQPGQQQQSPSARQLAGSEEPEAAEPAYRAIRGDGQVDLLA